MELCSLCAGAWVLREGGPENGNWWDIGQAAHFYSSFRQFPNAYPVVHGAPPEHGCALRHVDGLHAGGLQAKHLGSLRTGGCEWGRPVGGAGLEMRRCGVRQHLEHASFLCTACVGRLLAPLQPWSCSLTPKPNAHLEANHEPRHFLAVRWEVASLYGQGAAAAVAQHALAVGVPRHAVGTLGLKQRALPGAFAAGVGVGRSRGGVNFYVGVQAKLPTCPTPLQKKFDDKQARL